MNRLFLLSGSYRISDELLEALFALRERDGMDVGDALRQALTEYLTRKKVYGRAAARERAETHEAARAAWAEQESSLPPPTEMDPRSLVYPLPALRTADAAMYCGISKGTLSSWRSNKGGQAGPPYYKIGGAVVYRVADLDDWLRKHRRGYGEPR